MSLCVKSIHEHPYSTYPMDTYARNLTAFLCPCIYYLKNYEAMIQSLGLRGKRHPSIHANTQTKTYFSPH